MRSRWVARMLLLLLAAPLITGCWDRREPEETAFVLAVGVDKGERSRYAVTAIIAIPDKLAGKGGGGGGGKDEKPFVQTTVEAPTVVAALGLINSYVDRQVSLLHTRAFFLHEDLARKGQLDPLDEFVRFRQTRRGTFFLITREKAATFLKKMEPKMRKDPQRFIEQLTYNVRYSGLIPAESQIQSFITHVDTGYVQPVAYYASLREEDEQKEKDKGKDKGKKESYPEELKSGELPVKGGPNVEMVGAAAFKRNEMVGTLAGTEMRLVLMLQDRFQRGFVTFDDPQSEEDHITVDLRRSRPVRVAVDLSGQRPKIRAEVTLEGELTSLQSGIDYTEPESKPKLENALSRELEHDFERLIAKTQRWNADVAGFGRHVVRQFATVEQWDKYNWPDQYKNADVAVKVKVHMRRFGLQLSPRRASQ